MSNMASISDRLLASNFSYMKTRSDMNGESDVFDSPEGLSIVVRLDHCDIVPDALVASSIALEADGAEVIFSDELREEIETRMWEKIDHEDGFVLSYAYGRPPGRPAPAHGEVIPASSLTAFDTDLTP